MRLSGFEHHRLGPARRGLLAHALHGFLQARYAAYAALNARLSVASSSVERRAIKPDFIKMLIDSKPMSLTVRARISRPY